jgi:hypothetical protein
VVKEAMQRDLIKLEFLNKLVLLCFSMFLATSGMSQEAVLTTSSNATGTEGSVDYSVGQVAFRTIESSGGTLTEGVQQPYEILFMTGVENDPAVSLKATVFPNPAESEVTLKVDRLEYKGLKFRLMNDSGILLQEKEIVSGETVVPVGSLLPGIYFVTLVENQQTISTWKVIKK